ncbi:MAG: endonuclease/exonuclease/phosphatase family protein [Mycobacteriales bacterium]
MRAARHNRLLVLLAAAGAIGASVVAQATSAAASSLLSGAKFTGATHTSLTVTASGHAQRYRLYVSQVHHQLIASNLRHDASSGWRSSKTLTVTGLRYSTTPYFFRVVAESGSRHAYSATYGPVGLKPTTPTGVTISFPFGRDSITWTGGTGTGFIVDRASDAGFTTGLHRYTLIGPGQQFTPPDVAAGAPNYFRVRAVNNGTLSSPSAAVSGSTSKAGTTITTMTYNIREASVDGQPDGKNYGAPWNQRKGPAAALIRSASPDVIAVEEAASFVDGSSTERQADSLVNALGSPYKLARTEIPPTEKHYFRTGDYIIYNSNTVHADDPAGAYPDTRYWDLGHSSLGHQHWAAYQEFTDIATGARFLFVAFHLIVVNANPSVDDAARQDQAQSMIRQAQAFTSNLPTIFAGDTNSAVESSHVVDGPRVAMRAHQIADAFDVAGARHHTKYNTGNQYYPKPPASRIYLDAIFAQPGVGVASWDELLHLSHGKFVLPIPSDHNPVVARVVIPT